MTQFPSISEGQMTPLLRMLIAKFDEVNKEMRGQERAVCWDDPGLEGKRSAS